VACLILLVVAAWISGISLILLVAAWKIELVAALINFILFAAARISCTTLLAAARIISFTLLVAARINSALLAAARISLIIHVL
jgi:hypothetical protein